MDGATTHERAFLPRPDAPVRVEPGPPAPLSLCVLASSSSGNCSALVSQGPDGRRLFLIDLGLSPRRTFRNLELIGLQNLPIAGAILTHLDDDHCHAAWAGHLPDSARLFIHKRHRGRAERAGLLYGPTELFDDGIDIAPDLRLRSLLMHHDDLGVAVLRFESTSGSPGSSLGFATDLGQIDDNLVRHLEGVDVLAIESNYCPRMQDSSDRPEFLKRRIMGGHGHLSNAQCAEASRLIGPREHVVLLHLSRQCNTPKLASLGHTGRPYALTIACHDTPTPWIRVKACPS